MLVPEFIRVLSKRPCLWSVSQSLKIHMIYDIQMRLLITFLIFCIKLGHYKGTKVTEPDF